MFERLSIIHLPDGTTFETPTDNEDDAIRVQRIQFQGKPEYKQKNINIYATPKVVEDDIPLSLPNFNQ